MGGELEDSALAIRASGDDTDISWVIDGYDNTSCENDFFPL
jgi:hypothetical protein